MDETIVQQEAVRQQRRAQDQVGHGQSFHTGVDGTHRVVTDDRQTPARQDKQRQQVADDSDDADDRNEYGFDDRIVTGADLEQR